MPRFTLLYVPGITSLCCSRLRVTSYRTFSLEDTSMPILPDMVGITVADIPRAIRFYRLIGLDFPDASPGAGEDYVEVKTSNGYRISLNSEELDKKLTPDWQAPRGQRVALAFLCDSPAEVDKAHAAVVAAGHKSVKEPWDAFWGQRYAVVEDPDGAHVSLFAPLKK
jgi:catechol 2,3-dioxygenase-like lactoylglutathione lyase family enzyme